MMPPTALSYLLEAACYLAQSATAPPWIQTMCSLRSAHSVCCSFCCRVTVLLPTPAASRNWLFHSLFCLRCSSYSPASLLSMLVPLAASGQPGT